MKDKDDACTDLLKLDQAHRKLAKENKELLKKHEQLCTEMKIVKGEKEQLSRENNALSVALKASKKDLKENLETFEKERKGLQIELVNLNKFKVEKEAEQKKIKKAEKINRQRDKKQNTDNSDYKDYNSNDTLENNSDNVMNAKPQPSDQHMSDAFKDAEIEDSEDVEIEASETCKLKSVSNLSDSLISTASAPLTVNDLEDWLKSVAKRYKT